MTLDWVNARRPHFAGAAFSKTWLIWLFQRCRRTRRDPSSSNERRRKVARKVVRCSFMMPRYSRIAYAVKVIIGQQGRPARSNSILTLAHAEFGASGCDY